jgi:(2Fe-2S) ferredoxin
MPEQPQSRKERQAKARENAAKLGLPGVSRHVLVCTAGACGDGRPAVKHLARRLREEGLARREVHLSEADCLGVCIGGPTMIVYPDGTWYGEVTPDNAERILREHLQEGRRVEDLVTIEAPLGPAETSA